MLRMGGSGLITVCCDLKENLEMVEVLWQLQESQGLPYSSILLMS